MFLKNSRKYFQFVYLVCLMSIKRCYIVTLLHYHSFEYIDKYLWVLIKRFHCFIHKTFHIFLNKSSFLCPFEQDVEISRSKHFCLYHRCQAEILRWLSPWLTLPWPLHHQQHLGLLWPLALGLSEPENMILSKIPSPWSSDHLFIFNKNKNEIYCQTYSQ